MVRDLIGKERRHLYVAARCLESFAGGLVSLAIITGSKGSSILIISSLFTFRLLRTAITSPLKFKAAKANVTPASTPIIMTHHLQQ